MRRGKGIMAQSRPDWSGDDLGLFTDLYELTMAQVYFDQGMFAPATFSLLIRNHPPSRGYLVFAGLEDALEYLEELSFDDEQMESLRSQGIFSEEFLEYLGGVRFTGSVRALAEGRLFFADEPVLEVTAPIIEAQLAETYIINQVNLQSLQATKAARCVWAARGQRISDFGSRRAQGVDAALKMAKERLYCGFRVDQQRAGGYPIRDTGGGDDGAFVHIELSVGVHGIRGVWPVVSGQDGAAAGHIRTRLLGRTRP